MLTAEGCRTRRARLWERLAAGKGTEFTSSTPDWLLIADPAHLVYFGNYFPSQFVFRSANAAALLILGADGTSILVADNLVRTFAEQAHVDELVLPVWYEGRASAEHRRALVVRAALERLRQCPGRRLGVEASAVPAGLIERLRAERGELELANLDPAIHLLRRAKDPDEQDLVRRSMAAADAAHAAALSRVRPGMTELHIFQLASQAAQEAAGEQVLVYGDFVSGPNCQNKGGPPSARVIEPGDLVLLDFSVVVHGYRGDFANTFVCGAQPTPRQRQLHAACLEALAAGERLIRAGRNCRELDQALRTSFAAQGLAEFFTSHSGHGLGLGHPDPPYIVPESSDTLVAGDVIALEPGLYIPGEAGMRFERNYLVTQEGYELLSHLALDIEQPMRA